MIAKTAQLQKKFLLDSLAKLPKLPASASPVSLFAKTKTGKNLQEILSEWSSLPLTQKQDYSSKAKVCGKIEHGARKGVDESETDKKLGL